MGFAVDQANLFRGGGHGVHPVNKHGMIGMGRITGQGTQPVSMAFI